MSLMVLYKYLEKHINTNEELKNSIDVLAEKIIENEELEKQLEGLCERRFMLMCDHQMMKWISEARTRTLKKQTETEQEVTKCFEMALELQSNLEDIDVEAIYESKLHKIQTKFAAELSEMEVEFNRKREIYENMENREIVKKLRLAQRKHKEMLENLENVKLYKKNTMMEYQKRIEESKQKRNEKIINLIKGGKELQKLREEITFFSNFKENIKAMEKRKEELTLKVQTLKAKKTNTMTSCVNKDVKNSTTLGTPFFTHKSNEFLKTLNLEINPILINPLMNYMQKGEGVNEIQTNLPIENEQNEKTLPICSSTDTDDNFVQLQGEQDLIPQNKNDLPYQDNVNKIPAEQNEQEINIESYNEVLQSFQDNDTNEKTNSTKKVTWTNENEYISEEKETHIDIISPPTPYKELASNNNRNAEMELEAEDNPNTSTNPNNLCYDNNAKELKSINSESKEMELEAESKPNTFTNPNNSSYNNNANHKIPVDEGEEEINVEENKEIWNLFPFQNIITNNNTDATKQMCSDNKPLSNENVTQIDVESTESPNKQIKPNNDENTKMELDVAPKTNKPEIEILECIVIKPSSNFAIDKPSIDENILDSITPSTVPTSMTDTFNHTKNYNKTDDSICHKTFNILSESNTMNAELFFKEFLKYSNNEIINEKENKNVQKSSVPETSEVHENYDNKIEQNMENVKKPKKPKLTFESLLTSGTEDDDPIGKLTNSDSFLNFGNAKPFELSDTDSEKKPKSDNLLLFD